MIFVLKLIELISNNRYEVCYNMKTWMNLIFELFKVALPAFIAFVATKYSCDKNKPTDKKEAAYDRFYYPVNKFLCSLDEKNIDYGNVIHWLEIYFERNDKLIDITTKRCFTYFKKAVIENYAIKNTYRRMKDNIDSKCIYLRNSLGYIQSNFIQLLIYMNIEFKILLACYISFILMYILLLFYSIFPNEIIVVAALILLFVAMLSAIFYFIFNFKYFILKYMKWIGNNLKKKWKSFHF